MYVTYLHCCRCSVALHGCPRYWKMCFCHHTCCGSVVLSECGFTCEGVHALKSLHRVLFCQHHNGPHMACLADGNDHGQFVIWCIVFVDYNCEVVAGSKRAKRIPAGTICSFPTRLNKHLMPQVEQPPGHTPKILPAAPIHISMDTTSLTTQSDIFTSFSGMRT